jgi:hypothetical protein
VGGILPSQPAPANEGLTREAAARIVREPMSAATRSALLHVLAAAVVLTVLNVPKPYTEDDPSYYRHVLQVAHHPLDPYGGEMYFRERFGPAVHNVAPPVPVYWLALGARVSGDDPGLFKLWLLPFCVLLLGTVFVLLRRFARGFERPGVWLLALSPPILPSLNLMFDVPALALSLASILCFWRAAERSSLTLALAAGLIAGLAIETKYTGFSILAVVVAIGWMRGQVRLALAACVVAVACFVGWETWVHGRYGESQFLFFLGRRERGETGPTDVALIRPLVRTLGPIGAALVPLGLLALGAGPLWVIAAMVAVVGVQLTFALAPPGVARLAGGSFYNLTLGWIGPVLLAIAIAVIWRLSVRRRVHGATTPSPRWRRDPETLFLEAWLAIEIAAYIGISTFPAARRMLGVFVVLFLVIARLASRAMRRAGWRRRIIPALVAAGAVLGLLYFAVDFDDAWSDRRAVDRVRSAVEANGGGTIWFLATHWGGFQFYGPRAGLRPVVPGRSWLVRGDWLFIPWNISVKNRLTLADSCVERIAVLDWDRRLPVTTREAFYHGTRPLRRPESFWRGGILYRVTRSGCLVGLQENPYQP